MVNAVISQTAAAAALNYNTSTVSNERAADLGATFSVVVDLIIADDCAMVDQMEILSARDKSRILNWNDKALQSENTCVHELIHTQATQTPEKLAIHGWDVSFTYEELDRISTHLAHHLNDIGVGPKSIVPLCFNKSAWAIVAMLAIIKSGAAFVSLDPKHPELRLKSILASIEATYILGGAAHADLFNTLDVTSLLITQDTLDSLPVHPDQSLRYVVKPTDPVSVVFTSGSTGQPKGIVLEHASIVTSAAAHGSATGLGTSSRVLQFAAYTFDVSMQDIFTTLMRGACVCVISDEDRVNNLAEAIRNFDIDWACLTSTVASTLKPTEVPNLETLVLGGEPATQGVIECWAEKVDLFNVYGPAESSIWTSCATILNETDDPANIGFGLANRLWIADKNDHNKLAPIGAVGELLLEGPLLAREYLKDEQKTNLVFIVDPAWSIRIRRQGDVGSRRFYKTGDLVQYQPDGSMRFIERRDTQVKLNGQRLELGEIEHYSRILFPDAQQVAVDVVSAGLPAGTHKLAAFVQLGHPQIDHTNVTPTILSNEEEWKPQISEVQSQLRERLPGFMVPSVFVSLRQMPTTTSGKLDRKTLRQILSQLPVHLLTESFHVVAQRGAPSNEIEATLASLWAHVLEIPENSLGTVNNFFASGGDSVTAMKLVSQARRAGLSLSVRTIFQQPQLHEMAMAISQSSARISGPAKYDAFSLLPDSRKEGFLTSVVPPLNFAEDDVQDVLPATDFQALALTGMLMKTRWMLNFFWFDGEGLIDEARLKTAFSHLVQNYDILRTVFALHEDQYVQVVLREINLSFKVVTTRQELSEFTKELRATDFQSQLSLSEPLVKLVLVRHENTERYRIIIRLSHANYDGFSLPKLWKSLFACYQGNFEPSQSSFSMFMAHTTARSSSESRSHWRNLLSGSSMTQIVPHRQLRCLRADDPTTTIQRCVAAPTKFISGFTPATLVKAAWANTLSMFSGKDDIVFGHVVSGRNDSAGGADFGGVVGPCVNIIPVRTAVIPNTKAIDLLRQVQSQQVSNIPFESFGFRKIIRECTDWPTWNHYSSVVQHENSGDGQRSIPLGDGAKVQLGVLGSPELTADIYVFSMPENGRLQISLTATANVFASTASILLDALCDTIESWTSMNLEQKITPAWITDSCSRALVNGHGDDVSSGAEKVMPDDESALKATKVLQRVWRQVLRVDGNIAIDESFLDCGGDLIMAGQITLLLRQDGYAITVEDLVEHPTMAQQVDLLLN
jgi:amino acid adenylation domain-containing protein